MGTGLGGVDPADAARAMVDELRAHRQPKPSTVYLVDIDDEILMCLEERSVAWLGSRSVELDLVL